MYNTYLLNVRSFMCNFELYINDVLVQSEYNDNYLTFELQTNQWLKKKENLVKVRVLPLKSHAILQPRARVEMLISILIENALDSSKSQRNKVLELNTIDTQQGDLDKLPSIDSVKVFFVRDEFMLPWLDAPVFQVNQENQKQLFDLYKQIHKLFSVKDINGVMNLFYQKHLSCAKALNQTESAFVSYAKKGLEEVWNDVDNKLWPLEKQQLSLRYFASGKLVSLYNELNQPAILYYNEKENASTFIDVFCMNTNEQQPVVIR